MLNLIRKPVLDPSKLSKAEEPSGFGKDAMEHRMRTTYYPAWLLERSLQQSQSIKHH